MRALKEQKASRQGPQDYGYTESTTKEGSYKFDRERQENAYPGNHPRAIAKEILDMRSRDFDRNEVLDFNVHLNNRIALQKQALSDWQQLHKDIHNQYKGYKDHFVLVKEKADANLKRLQNAVDNKNLLDSDFSLNVDQLEADIEPELREANEMWISTFVTDQSEKFNSIFHQIAQRVTQQRLSQQFLEKRKKVEEALKEHFSQLDKIKGGQQVDPFIKHDLLGVIKKVSELQQLDGIVPGILEDLKSKPDEYIKNLKPVLQDFLRKLRLLTSDMEKLVVRDAAYKDLYKALENEDPNQIRASKYGKHIVNSDLLALKLDRPPVKVMEFYLNYLAERLAVKNQEIPDGEKLFLAESLYDIHGQEGSILKELTKNALAKTTYKRVGLIISLASDHYILVEVMINNLRGVKELCIYDSNLKEYQHVHSKLYTLFKDIAGDIDVGAMTQTGGWQRDTGKMSMTMSASSSSFMRVKQTNCPQVLSRTDSGLYALKNAQLFCENLKPGPGSYSFKDMETFRYDVFATIVKSKFSDIA